MEIAGIDEWNLDWTCKACGATTVYDWGKHFNHDGGPGIIHVDCTECGHPYVIDMRLEVDIYDTEYADGKKIAEAGL